MRDSFNLAWKIKQNSLLVQNYKIANDKTLFWFRTIVNEISCQLKQASRISESNGEFRHSRKHILHVNWVERCRHVLGLNLGK